MISVNERIKSLRREMEKRSIDIYIVPTADFHESEYVGEYFAARKFITGFTGSAGIAVITAREANLWTDGRYFVQAAAELMGSEVILRKMGQEGVPTIPEYLRQMLPEKGLLGFDGRVINAKLGRTYEAIAEEKGGSLYTEEDLIDLIWTDRPAMSSQPAWILENQYSGKDIRVKLADIRAEMKKKNCPLQLVSCLYDIAWILNIRGNDISYVPVVLSYLAIDQEKCIWFVQEEALDDKVRAYLGDNQIEVRPYFDFYTYVKEIPENTLVWADPAVLNYRAWNSIPASCSRIAEPIPSVRMRSMKNDIEMANTRIAHIKDAVAMIQFMHWVKTNVGKIPMDEYSVAEHLAGLRAQQEGFLDLSFSTISGYAENGAIVHYHVHPETAKELKPEGLLLVDSGGHYLEGTTDITRTFALGPVTDEMKSNFTRVLRSNRDLANARFLYGCSGINLDILARGPLWEAEMDYNHGTGHGVGHILNVHEGPQSIRWRAGASPVSAVPLEEGMITSDEPGLYLEGKYGIRIENEILCRKGTKNTYGQFMYFEELTLVPIDLDAVAVEEMSDRDKALLNAYHKEVYEKMSPYFEGEMKEWLAHATRAI